jgi:hypothetical protein
MSAEPVGDGGALDGPPGVADVEGLGVAGSVADPALGLAVTAFVASEAVGTPGGTDEVTPHAASPMARKRRTVGRRTSVTPGRAGCTG